MVVQAEFFEGGCCSRAFQGSLCLCPETSSASHLWLFKYTLVCVLYDWLERLILWFWVLITTLNLKLLKIETKDNYVIL